MRFYAFLAAFIFFASAPVFAEPTDDAKKAECIAFYDEKAALSKTGQENSDVAEIARLEKEGATKELWKLALAPFKPLFEISDKSYECGKHDKRFYEMQLNLCATFTYGQDSWGQDGRKYIFNNLGKPYFCDPAVQRGDEIAFIHVLKYYMLGLGGEKNYKKALDHLQKFSQMNPKSSDVILFAIPIYLNGGYGIEKNEKKAFEIWKQLYHQNPEKAKQGEIPCKISLYYKNGIGTPKNERNSEKWLKIYQKNNPDKKCEPHDWSYWFAEKGHSKPLYKEESE